MASEAIFVERKNVCLACFMIRDIAENFPSIALQLRMFEEEAEDHLLAIAEIADSFLADYCALIGKSARDVGATFLKFQRQYSKDLKAFKALHNYHGIVRGDFQLSREEYDIALILSVSLSIPRALIMSALKTFNIAGDTVVVGVGSGLELEYLSRNCKITAYDPQLAVFPQRRFPKVLFRESVFDRTSGSYSHFLAIELLEHIYKPFDLLLHLIQGLKIGGTGIFTTALNLPQFDHVYNFESVDEVESFCRSMACAVLSKQVVPHHYHDSDFESNNIIWIIRKEK